MEETLVQAIIWAIVVLVLGGAGIWRLDVHAKSLLELRRERERSAEADAAVERMERQNEAELAQRTLDETAELEKARLLLEAAETRTAAMLADSPELSQARIAEEQAVIAARAEGRALAAKERAMSQKESTSSSLEVLTQAYLEARRASGMSWTFDYWLGDRELPM